MPQYDRIGDKYDKEQSIFYTENGDDSRTHAFSILPSLCNASVLDLGCGSGIDTNFFLNSGARYTGLDESSTMIENAKRRHCHSTAKFVIASFENALPFSGQSFDFIYSRYTLHYADDPKHVFRECYRILKPGGRVVAIISHPLLNLFLQKEKRYGSGEIISVPLYDGKVIVRHPARTFAHFLTPAIAVGFILEHFFEQYPFDRTKTVDIDVDVPEYFILCLKKE